MKVIIIEDELPALDKLRRYINQYDNSIEIVAELLSVSEAVDWIAKPGNDFDLGFLDIQLTDGISFDIFNNSSFDKPVIFVTAHEYYAIDAFKVNSIDYILKPITYTDISRALTKFKNLKSQLYPSAGIQDLLSTSRYKDRFMVRLGNHIHSIKTVDIYLFYAEGRDVFLITTSNKKYMIDFNLEALESILNPKGFFRINRSYIINIDAINEVVIYSGHRLKANLKIDEDHQLIVSRNKVQKFKSWFEGI